MRTPPQTPSKLQPLGVSLARFRSAAAIVAALMAAAQSTQAVGIWDGGGDGFSWTDPLNWDTNTVPTATDIVNFASVPPATAILLLGNQTADSLGFTQSYTLGAYGTNQVLTDTTGNISVTGGNFATINASYGGSAGLNLSGGGTLYLNHPAPTFAGNITVDGAGTTLVHRQEGLTPQYNGVGSAQEFGRSDQASLGFTTATRTITLTNGGVYKIVNAGNNPELNYKNIVIGTGGGTLNLAAGYLLQNLDDVGQITATTEAFTKAGKGRLAIGGLMADANPLGGVVNINGGMISLDRLQVGGVAGTRFAGIATAGSTVNINSGGTLLLNSTTQGRLDVQTVNLNDGGTLALQGNTHFFGLDAGGTSLNTSGTSTVLLRDLYGPQVSRFQFWRNTLTGAGTLNLVGSTGAGNLPRLVVERGSESTFTGTFRLVENTSLEANPRFNPTASFGKTIADGDIEFAGWGGTLDVRDSNSAAASVFDYTSNEITVTTTQNGALNTISLGRGDLATGTGHLFNLGTLTMGNHRLVIAGNNSYQAGFADTASIRGNAIIIMNSDNTPAVFSNAVAITEDAAGRSLTLIKAGTGGTVARDVIVGGSISLSNLEVATGTLQLRGVLGAIGTGFGGVAPTITINGGGSGTTTNGLPTQGLLNLDGSIGYVVGATTVFAAGNNNDRIVDSATLNMRSNSILRLTSASGVATTETIGTTNVSGHATFDVVLTGAPAAPVVLTLTTLNLTGTSPTANFTGPSLGLAGNNARILIPGFVPAGSATVPTFMGSQFHSGNEWAKYDALGVTPFVATDYTINPAAPVAGVYTKYNGATGIALAAAANTNTLNLQFSATAQSVNLAGFVLRLDQGGILTSANTAGIVDGATGAAPSGTAGITSLTPQLYVHNSAQLDIRTPVTGAIDFVKSGTGTVRLTHQSLGVGTGVAAIAPFTAATWTSMLAGNWIINDGRLEVHRGQFLGGRPVILNGGHLEINQPVSNANADSIITGWNNNIIINGNATVAADDNGETDDANGGDRALVKLGSLTINNGSIMSHGSFSDIDIAYMGGATFAGTPSLNAIRGGVNSATIINGVLAGSGFNMLALAGNSASLVLGGGPADATPNTYGGAITVYAGSLRPNKANGTLAITDGPAAEDVVINGGSLFWGPGQHGDLVTTNSVNTLNNGLASGIAPTSPAAIKLAGMNQIADTATITLLFGTLGEGDRITNEKWGTLIMKNGTFNVGLGTVELDSATFTGGALGFDRGGTLKIGTASYLPGAFDQSVFTGRPGSPGAYTTLEIGAGGISLTGQNITVGNGFSGNVAGAGGRLRLGGNLTFTGTDLIGGSYGRKGIFVQTGSTFRELGASHIDLMGDVRDFNIAEGSIFTVTPRIINGGISKSGGGALVLEPYEPSTFTGSITVNGGILQAKGDGAFGTSAGGVTINFGATVKLDSSWTYGDAFSVGGAGSIIPGSGSVREGGALISESGTNRLTGAFSLNANATLASNTFLDPSVTPGAGGLAYRLSTLVIAASGGITGAGTNLTLSGFGDGIISNGVHTTSGSITKDGGGRWIIGGPSTYSGPTNVTAGMLRITDGAALGTTLGTTTVYGGALELDGGLSTAEPLKLYGDGASIQSGALVNVSGNNTLTGAVTLGSNATLRADAGTLTLGAGATVTGPGFVLTLAGNGNGFITDAIAVGSPGGDALIKNGLGTWTLSGNATSAGDTTVNGGTLIIASAGSALDAGAVLKMNGGTITVSGAAQTAGALVLVSGGSTVNGGAGLAVGTLNRSGGATGNFSGLVNAAGSVNTNGIIGSYATVGTNWAALNGSSNVTAFSGYVALDAVTAAATDNASLLHFTPFATALVRNTVKIVAGSGFDLAGNTLTLTAGGLLHAGSAPAAIGGTGLLSGNTSADELVVTVAGSGALDIAAPIIGAGVGSLTKAGNGMLILSGTSAFTGSVNINAGTLLIPGAPSFPGTLGGSVVNANRLININGGSLGILADWDINDWDAANPGIQSFQLNIGSAGGTVKTLFSSQIQINDGSTTAAGLDQQLQGSGNLTFTGGGRYNLSGGVPQFLTFTGKTTVDTGILTLGHSNSLGGRQEQTITLKAGSEIINATGFGLGQNGLPNNIVAEGGVEFFASGGNRVYAGDIQLTGTNTVGLFEAPSFATNPINQERQVYFNGRVSGTGITLNVFGSNNANPFYLASGSNPITGTINLNPNAVLEVRGPGSVGVTTGDVTVNLATNSRLFLRHFQNGDFRTNVVINGNAEVNSDRLVNYAGGGLQILSINNLTLNGDSQITTIGGGNTYHTRVGGTATFNAATNTILNVTASDLILENGITFGTPGSTLDKRGGFTAILRGPTNHTGKLIIQGGLVHLQDNGSLAGTTSIELRGGELRVDNSAVVNTNRINDAATITLGGGVLRLTGTETLGVITAVGGTTLIINNPTDETVPNPLTLTGFTRATGSVVQFQSPDVGAGALAVGQNTFAQTRVGSRIFIPGQANTTQTIPGFLGNNSVDFIQYDGTTTDSGFALGVRDMRNPGNVNSPANYTDNAAETAWVSTTILHRTLATDNAVVTDTLTASRALDAIKVETGGTNRDYTIALGANNIRINGGGIVVVANTTADFTITGTTGVVTAGPAAPGAATAELVIGGNGTAANGTVNINAIIANNGTQPVALVKTGISTLNLNGAAANTYTGGTYVNSGTLNVLTNSALGGAGNQITLSGGTLQFNITNAASAIPLGGLGQTINVNANSTIILDNGVLTGVDNDLAFGALNINGPYTLSLRSFDSMDATFTAATHTFAGTPLLDMAQVAAGGNGTGFFTINGNITGSGFMVGSSGNANDTTSILQIGGGESVANTYAGKFTLLLGTNSAGSNSEDNRVELNKAAGFNAITGDIEIDGGILRNIAANQIADTSNMVINQGSYDAFGNNETIASVTMRGGNFRTSSPGTGGSTVTVTGNFESTGADDLTGSGDGVAVNSNTTLAINGTLKLNGYGKATIGATNGVMTVGGLEMTGTTLTLNAGGSALLRLNGNVTTFASVNVARIGNNTTSGSVELNGTRTFAVADGTAGVDLSVSGAVVNSTSPVAAGGLTKTGAGTMQLEGSGTVNSYSGPTAVNNGILVLFKSAGVNATGDGSATNTLAIGDGSGGSRADQVIIRNSNQIADTTAVTIASSGLLDLDTFNTSETIGDLNGVAGGVITLGPTSTLTVGTATAATSYAGSIEGGGAVIKQGTGELHLKGPLNVWTITASAGTLDISANGNYAVVNANSTTNLYGSQDLSALNVGAGVTLTFGDTPPPFAGTPDDKLAGLGGSGVVPEPGSIGLLLVGALGLLGRRRRS